MGIERLGIVGAGTMGSGIAQVAAQVGLKVVLIDIEKSYVEQSIKKIIKNWEKEASKGKIQATDIARFSSNIKGNTQYNDLQECELIIEAVIENIEIKKKVFKEIGEICPPHVVIATNTSALSITEIAAASGRPDRVIGMHFFNPVPVMQLVEVIPGAETSESTIQLAMEASRQLGKTPILAKESPGFIVNRLLVPYLNEACTALQEGVASAEDIDKAMRLGANMPIGPLALCDLVGLDVLLMVVEYFYREYGDPKFRPALVLKQKVRAGHLGVKTGRGFFNY